MGSQVPSPGIKTKCVPTSPLHNKCNPKTQQKDRDREKKKKKNSEVQSECQLKESFNVLSVQCENTSHQKYNMLQMAWRKGMSHALLVAM